MKKGHKLFEHPLGMKRPVLEKPLVSCIAYIYILLLEWLEMCITGIFGKQRRVCLVYLGIILHKPHIGIGSSLKNKLK